MYTKEQVLEKSLEYFNQDQLAASVFADKYALQHPKGTFHELTPDDMHRRMAAEFARIDRKFEPESNTEELYYSLMSRFKYIIPQGSPMYGIGNDFTLSSLSNCVVVSSPEDDISSIMNHGKDLANLFKRRCGVGIDISNLRPDGTLVSNAAGTTSGAWSFADYYSYVCRMIGQNGRRGALMISMSVEHPDIAKFIVMKQDKTKVTGANVSVRITDKFMNAVINNETYTQRWPLTCPAKITKEVPAREVWDLIVKAATDSAEPGILMWDNCIGMLPAECYPEFKSVTTNPCGEVELSPFDSCRLIAINLNNFVINPFQSNAYFDIISFRNVVAVAMRMCDNLVELELEKLNAIYRKVDTADEEELWKKLISSAANGRRTGLGTVGLANVFAQLGLEYGSPESIKVAGNIFKVLANTAYMTSSQLAKTRGSFPVYNADLEAGHPFISQLDPEVQESIRLNGRRNISILTQAPTGSVAIEAQVNSGLEPFYRLSYGRRKKISHNDTETIPTFIDTQGDKWIDFVVHDHCYQQYIERFGEPETPPAFFTTSDKIDWKQRVMMQAAIQQWIDHSISSTINLPRGTSYEVVSELYQLAWENGLKGVTVYVDGCRDGVLIEAAPAQPKPQLQEHHAPKRPAVLECDIVHMTVGCIKWIFLVGLLQGKPYEVFGGAAGNLKLPEDNYTGTITKITEDNKTRYELSTTSTAVDNYVLEDHIFTVPDITNTFKNQDYGSLTRMVSTSLRHGVPINFIVEQLQKDPNSDLYAFNRVLARVLKTYIPEGLAISKICSECQQPGLVYQEGCMTCTNCGYAKCG